MRYTLEFRKLTFYGLTRPQCIRKLKQISGQTVLSSPQDAQFNPNFAKNRDIPVVKNSVRRPVTPAVITTPTISTFYSTLILNMPNSSTKSILHISIHLSYLEESFCLDTTYSVELPKSRLFWATSARRRRPSSTRKQTLNNYSGVFH